MQEYRQTDLTFSIYILLFHVILIFQNISNCNKTEIWTSSNCCLWFWSFVFVLSLVVLDWYSSWFVGLMYERQQNESPYSKSVTITETVFTKRTLAWRLLVKKCHSEIHENSTVGLVWSVKCIIIEWPVLKKEHKIARTHKQQKWNSSDGS